jgi:hypothetical protein
MKKLIFAALCGIATTASANAEPMKYPNWFDYQVAYEKHWAEQYGRAQPSELPRPYFECNYTKRVCLDGTASYLGGRMQAFLGVVLDGDDRKTIIAHVECRGNFQYCDNYSTGVSGRFGDTVTMPDMPRECVEEMAKTGAECRGYSLSLGNVDQEPHVK